MPCSPSQICALQDRQVSLIWTHITSEFGYCIWYLGGEYCDEHSWAVLGGEYRDEQMSIIDGNVSLRNNEQTEQLAGFF